MPIELKPTLAPPRDTSWGTNLGADWQWLAKQDYFPSRIETSQGAFRRGSITGGPTYQQFLEFDDPKRWALVPPKPPLTDPVLAGQQTGASPSQRIGTVEINPTDLFATIEQLTGDAIGQRQALVGDQGSIADPQAFLRSKDISIFGGSQASAAPSRLADYALAFPAAVLNRMLGQRTAPANATVDPDMPYQFQRDPAYWDQLAKLDDSQLHVLARELASRYIDPARNSHLVDQLYSVFSKDRNTRVLGLTSGSDAIDYRAQVTAYGEAIGMPAGLAQPSGFAALPVIGTQLAKLAHGTTGWVPDEKVLQDFWNKLEPKSRLSYLGQAGLEQLGVDVVSSLPLFSGLGTVLEVAKGAGGLASTAYRAYDLTLMTAKWTMAAGVASATTNWALEAAWPAYAESMGKEVDLSRPVSSSAVAGIVNQIGYFSSGTLGVWPAARVTASVLRRGVAAATGLADESLGSVGLGGLRIPHVAQFENQLFRDGHGGSAAAREMIDVGFHPQGLRTSTIGTIVSYAMNRREAEIVRAWANAIRGRKTTVDEINNATPQQREIMANDSLSRMRETIGTKTEMDFRILQEARQPRPLNPSRDAKQMRDVIDRAAHGLEDDLAKAYVHDYGPPHLRDLAGEYTAPALEQWVKAKTAELGFDPSKWGKHDTEGWAQRARAVYQYRFHAANGELFHAAEGARESPRLSMFRQDSLFADVRDDALKVFDAGDVAAAEARKVDILTGTKEGREFFAEWPAPDGVEKTIANVKLSTVQRWLEDIGPALPVRRILPDAASMTAGLPLNAFHARLVDEGLWTLGFKPANDVGEFVSYVHTRDGGVFKSPWLDYPIHQRDNIELGNRGWLAGKMDSITAGYRTWRIIEFQRGALFRRISSRFPGVSSAQIEALHRGVLDLSREHKINPQAVGTLPASATLVKGLTKDVDALVERIFGKGPLRGADGKLHLVDWRHEIGIAYRQSLKLNLTAGLTSHLKSRFDGLGSAVALASDVAYIEARFNMSPIFKGGEWWETAQFNGMNGLGIRPDPLTQAAYYRAGVGNDYGTIAEELTAEHMVQGAARGGLDLPRDSGSRFAASMAFYARRLPSDLAADTSRAAAHAAVDAIRTKETMLDEAIDTIRRDGEAIDPETGAPLGPQDIPDLEARALHTREQKPDLPPITQGDMEALLKQLRDTLATEPSPAPAHMTPLQERLHAAIGENGIYPGLEERASQILTEMESLQRALGDDGGPVFALADAPASLRERFWWTESQAEHPNFSEEAFSKFQRQPSSADGLEEIAGTSEAVEHVVDDRTRSRLGNFVRTAWNPVPWKLTQQDHLQMKLMRDEFPALLRIAGADGGIKVFQQLKIPEHQWAGFLLEDRRLLDAFGNATDDAGRKAALAALIEHSGPDARGEFDALYASPAWDSLTALWSLNAKATADEAFQVHFFSPYRSAFERSINHPLLGFYPASWAIKSARIWFKFLYDNQMFGELHLGMTPAVAINRISNAQQVAFAMTNDDTLDHYLRKGPLGSTIFIFNLMMPGDWSAIPFPASRSIREILRGNFNPANMLSANLANPGLGAIRDVRLMTESMGELGALLFGTPEKDRAKVIRGYSVRGDDQLYGEPRR